MSATLLAGQRRYDENHENELNYSHFPSPQISAQTTPRLIDWNQDEHESRHTLGWSNGWTKRGRDSNFPEFVYAEFEAEQPFSLEQKKKRIDNGSESVDLAPQQEKECRIEI